MTNKEMQTLFSAFTGPTNLWSAAWDYAFDSLQRSILFMDIMRKRGNRYLDHMAAGQPPVLVFDYEINRPKVIKAGGS